MSRRGCPACDRDVWTLGLLCSICHETASKALKDAGAVQVEEEVEPVRFLSRYRHHAFARWEHPPVTIRGPHLAEIAESITDGFFTRELALTCGAGD